MMPESHYRTETDAAGTVTYRDEVSARLTDALYVEECQQCWSMASLPEMFRRQPAAQGRQAHGAYKCCGRRVA